MIIERLELLILRALHEVPATGYGTTALFTVLNMERPEPITKVTIDRALMSLRAKGQINRIPNDDRGLVNFITLPGQNRVAENASHE